MAFCLVCAEPLEDADTACRQCATACTDMNMMLHHAGKMTFLFGEVQAAALETVAEQLPAQPKAKPKPKPKPAKQRNESVRPLSTAAPSGVTTEDDVIHSRDVDIARPLAPLRDHFRNKVTAYILDVVICLIFKCV